MNKQEAIEKIEASKSPVVSEQDIAFNYALDIALNIIKELDEPEKPVIPQFVADYIDSEQYLCHTLSEALDNMDDKKRILDWFCANSKTFAKAWLFGYEVEKEKLYWVLGPEGNAMISKDDFDTISQTDAFTKNFQNKDKEHFVFTEQEIKSYDERYWAFAVEVEE